MHKEKSKKLKEFSCTPSSGESEQTFLIFEPTAKDIRDSEWKYKVTYSEALRNNVLTNKQMVRLLEDQGYDRNQELFAEFYERIAILEEDIEKSEDLETKYVLALQLREYREALYLEEMAYREPFYNTAESIAEEAQIDSLVSKIVCKSDKSLCWKDQQDYEDDISFLKDRAKYIVTMWFKGIEDDWEDDLVENKIFQEVTKVNQDRIEEQEEIEKETASKKDTSNGKKKPVINKKPASTRGRKKKVKNKAVENEV